MKLQDMTANDVVEWIGERPGCIQAACYPYSGEPTINESLYLDPSIWFLEQLSDDEWIWCAVAYDCILDNITFCEDYYDSSKFSIEID